MNGELKELIQASKEEWADIQKQISERERKDKIIISKICAKNDYADVVNIIRLLKKHNGLPEHDQQTIDEMEKNYPKKLTLDLLERYFDVVDVYSDYLENGGDEDE